MPDRSVEQRFWGKVEVGGPDECWLWTAFKNPKGYGMFWDGTRVCLAHRWAYERFVGSVPDGLNLDHFICDTPACVNPRHMHPVTPRENSLRGDSASARNAAKTHCPHGHPYDGSNTYIEPKSGGRRCRRCDYLKSRRYAEAARR
jgi:hypothetical protein